MQLYTIVYKCINSIQLIIYNFEFLAGNSKLIQTIRECVVRIPRKSQVAITLPEIGPG